MREASGNSTTMVERPGQIYQEDPFHSGIWLVSSINTDEILGEAIVTPVTDQFSHLIAGFSVGVKQDIMNSLYALYNSTLDKVEYYKTLGIDIDEHDAPAKGIPNAVITDRGPEFMTPKKDNLKNVGISQAKITAYRPDLKGTSEALNKLIKQEVRMRIKAGLLKKTHLPGDPDKKKKAYLIPLEFEKIVALCILKINRRKMKHYKMSLDMYEDKVSCRPNKIWEWGITHRSGGLHREDKAKILINLLLSGKASLSRKKGLTFGGFRYSNKRIEYEKLAIRPSRRGKEIPVSYHPDIPEVIFCHFKDGTIEQANIAGIDQEFEGKKAVEIKRARQNQKTEDENEEMSIMKKDAEVDKQIDQVLDGARERIKTQQSNGSKGSSSGNIRKNKKLEQQMLADKIRSELNTLPGVDIPPKAAEIVETETDEDTEDEYIPRPNYQEQIKRASGG